MTVCLAAICNNIPGRGVHIVGACDRMITIADIEFEPEQTKLLWLASHTVVLIAGEMRLHADAAPATYRAAQEMVKANPSVLVREIAEVYAQEFAKFQQYHAERHVLYPLKLTYESFNQNQQGMSSEYILKIKDELQKYNIDAEAIIAGIDQTGAHIYKIQYPGVVTSCDTECFAAIGIGEPHVNSQFMVARFGKNWPFEDSLLLAYTAKKRAQSNAGVGDATDLFFIGPVRGEIVIPKHMDAIKKTFGGMERGILRSEKSARKKLFDYVARENAASSVNAAPTPQSQSTPEIPDQSKSTTSSSDQT